MSDSESVLQAKPTEGHRCHTQRNLTQGKRQQTARPAEGSTVAVRLPLTAASAVALQRNQYCGGQDSERQTGHTSERSDEIRSLFHDL